MPKKVDACLKLESILPNAPLSHTWVLAKLLGKEIALAFLHTQILTHMDPSTTWMLAGQKSGSLHTQMLYYISYKMPSLAGGLLAC